MSDRTGVDLLVVGELNPDVVVGGVPVRDGRLRFGQAEDVVAGTVVTLGSSAAITACAAAAAGAVTDLVAVVGDDEFGRACLGWVARAGVGTARVRVAPGSATGSTVVLVSAEDPSDRHMLTHLGAMALLSADDLGDGALASARHVHVASFFLHTGLRDRVAERFAAARRLGGTTSLDTNDDPDRTWDSGVQAALAVTDLLFCNEQEARGLAGVTADGSVDDAVTVLLGRLAPGGDDGRFPAVVLKSGADGARVVTRRREVRVAAVTVDVVDTVGAGDTLAGTVLAALLAGQGWAGALALGVAAGTLSTTAGGGTAGQAGPRDVAALAATLPVASRDRHPTREAAS